MKTRLISFLETVDDSIDTVFIYTLTLGKGFPKATLAALILACLSLIFVAGPCSMSNSANEAQVARATIEVAMVNDSLSSTVQNIIDQCSSQEPLSDTSPIAMEIDGNLAKESAGSPSCEHVDDVEAAVSWSYFYKRPFFDKFPSDPHGTYNVYFFSDKSVAAYIEIEYMKQINEFFFFRRILNRFGYMFPYSKRKGISRFTLESCDGPGTFDLKLTIVNDPKADKKPRVFYSWRNFKQPK